MPLENVFLRVIIKKRGGIILCWLLKYALNGLTEKTV